MEERFLLAGIALAGALGIALLAKKYLVYVTQVSSGSMLPEINPNDRLLTVRVYHPEKLQRGDIIVFRSREKQMTMIKRLIGLPGDVIRIKANGDLEINGNLQKEPYVEYRGGPSDIYLVGAGEYFFLGDNRGASGDSRRWERPGIPEADILGKVKFSLYPWKKINEHM